MMKGKVSRESAAGKRIMTLMLRVEFLGLFREPPPAFHTSHSESVMFGEKELAGCARVLLGLTKGVRRVFVRKNRSNQPSQKGG